MKDQVLLIGIAGGSGSGKTTLAKNIAAEFGDSVATITHDSYYRAQDHLTFEERCQTNYDHPDAFETELLIQHLEDLKAGKSIEVPIYDYIDHNRSKESRLVESRPVVIVEGILIYADKRIADLMDMKIYVDTEPDIRLLRRIHRDVENRGRTLSSVLNQYQNTVKPMHDAFVEPTKRLADLIVPDGGENFRDLSVICAHVREKLQK